MDAGASVVRAINGVKRQTGFDLRRQVGSATVSLKTTYAERPDRPRKRPATLDGPEHAGHPQCLSPIYHRFGWRCKGFWFYGWDCPTSEAIHRGDQASTHHKHHIDVDAHILP